MARIDVKDIESGIKDRLIERGGTIKDGIRLSDEFSEAFVQLVGEHYEEFLRGAQTDTEMMSTMLAALKIWEKRNEKKSA